MEPRSPRLRSAALLVAAVLAAAACGDAGDEPPTTTATSAASRPPATAPATATASCADVVGVEATPGGDGTFTFAVTVRSPDTGWEKYADAWQVVGTDGAVLGTRELLHPHVEEQPFTRSLPGVAVPEGVAEVTVRARDSVAGWCGATMTATVPR